VITDYDEEFIMTFASSPFLFDFPDCFLVFFFGPEWRRLVTPLFIGDLHFVRLPFA